VDVDEHYNWGGSRLLSDLATVTVPRFPGLKRLVREVASWTGLRVCQTNGTEWTPLQLEGTLPAVRAFRDAGWEGMYLVGSIVPGLQALHGLIPTESGT
jgi:hypothetical protein